MQTHFISLEGTQKSGFQYSGLFSHPEVLWEPF